MRLLAATPYYLPKMGGLEHFTHACLKRLKRDYGYEVMVVTSNHNKDSSERDTYDGIDVVRLPIWKKISNTPIGTSWLSAMRDEIKNFNPDVVWGHLPVPVMADVAALASRSEGIHFMCTYHNDLVANSMIMKLGMGVYEQTLLRHTLGYADAITITTRRYGQESRVLNAYAKKIHVVTPGVDVERFENINDTLLTQLKTHKNISILFVSQLDRTHLHRGLDVLITALGMLKKQGATFLLRVVGRGDYVKEYKKMAKDAGIFDEVIFMGFVSDGDLPTYYKAADILALPSTSEAEGFGMVMIEAGYHGTAVVASRIGGIPEVLGAGEGLLVHPGDIQDLAEKLKRLFNDPALRTTLGITLQKKVREQYSWDTQVKYLDELIQEVVE